MFSNEDTHFFFQNLVILKLYYHAGIIKLLGMVNEVICIIVRSVVHG